MQLNLISSGYGVGIKPLAFGARKPKAPGRQTHQLHQAVDASPSGTFTEKQQQQLKNLAEMNTLTFRKQFQQVIREARQYLSKEWQHSPAQSAVVLDLDETLLDNSGDVLARISQPQLTFFDWVRRAEAPAIPETMAFVRWAKSKGFKLFFVTARREPWREATVLNLKKIGLPPAAYDGLYLKPVTPKGSPCEPVSSFKIGAQKAIEAAGYKVALMMGDQPTDVDGALGKGFKVPNLLSRRPGGL